MRTPLLLAFPLALCSAVAASAQADAPLALVTEAEAAVWPERAGDGSVAALDVALPGEPFATGPDGQIALHFADGLRVGVGASTTAALAGSYLDGAYAERGVVLDSGLVRYAFPEEPNAPVAFGMPGEAAAAVVASGTGGVIADADGLRLVVIAGTAELSDPALEGRVTVAAGEAGVVSGDGVSVRPSTLAERDLVAEPTARRRRLLVPGTDDEGNARTFIIEWDEG